MLAADRPLARIWFTLNAALVVYAVGLQISLTADEGDGYFTTPGERVANLFVFFTILSNLFVGVTCAVLAARPHHDGRLMHVARCVAVVGITATGILYHLLLASLYNLQGDDALADDMLHTVIPIVTVVGWLLFGPRGWMSRRVVTASMAYPLVYFAFTLGRGALIGWYPYPFLDVNQFGYATVGLNAVGITLLFLALGVVYAVLDRLLGRVTARGRTTGHSARIGA